MSAETSSFYDFGQRYARAATRAHEEAAAGNRSGAHARWAEADSLLGPLGDLDDPNDVRDFVAGAARFDEDRFAYLLEHSDVSEPTGPVDGDHSSVRRSHFLLGRLHGLVEHAAPRPPDGSLWKQIYEDAASFQQELEKLPSTYGHAYLCGIVDAVRSLPDRPQVTGRFRITERDDGTFDVDILTFGYVGDEAVLSREA